MVPDPVLIAGILSPSNEIHTWANIWAYTTIPRVREIVIVSSVRIEAELLRRNHDASWPEEPEEPEQIAPAASSRLKSVDFDVTLRTLYRTTPLAAG